MPKQKQKTKSCDSKPAATAHCKSKEEVSSCSLTSLIYNRDCHLDFDDLRRAYERIVKSHGGSSTSDQLNQCVVVAISLLDIKSRWKFTPTLDPNMCIP